MMMNLTASERASINIHKHTLTCQGCSVGNPTSNAVDYVLDLYNEGRVNLEEAKEVLEYLFEGRKCTEKFWNETLKKFHDNVRIEFRQAFAYYKKNHYNKTKAQIVVKGLEKLKCITNEEARDFCDYMRISYPTQSLAELEKEDREFEEALRNL